MFFFKYNYMHPSWQTYGLRLVACASHYVGETEIGR